MKCAIQRNPHCGINCDKNHFKTGYLWLRKRGKFLRCQVYWFPGTMHMCMHGCYWSVTAQVSVNSLESQGRFPNLYIMRTNLFFTATTCLQAIFLIMFIYNKNKIESQSIKLSCDSSGETLMGNRIKNTAWKCLRFFNVFIDCTFPYHCLSCHY